MKFGRYKMKLGVMAALTACVIMTAGCGAKNEPEKTGSAAQTNQPAQNAPAIGTVVPENEKEAGQSEGSSDSVGKEESAAASSPAADVGDSPANSAGGEAPNPAPQNPNPESLADKLIIPLASATAVLAAAVGWLIYDRKKRQPSPPVDVPPYPAHNSLSTPAKFPPTTFTPSDSVAQAGFAPASIHPVFRVDYLQNIGKRAEQQDSFCVSDVNKGKALREKGLLAIVADGMGGLDSGDAISKLTADTIKNSYIKGTVENPGQFLYHATAEAEKSVVSYMRRMRIKGGSTLVSVLIKADVLYFVSVGDSRIYLLRDGQLRQLNREHTYGEVLRAKARRGEVSPDAPFTDPDRHKLIAYIGMGSFNTVERGEIKLLPGDRVLLASDGVFNALGDDALIAALSTGDASAAARRLEADVLAQAIPEQDNFTGIVIEYVS